MQTNFSLAALADPAVQTSEMVLCTCEHCGVCTATGPTYLELAGRTRQAARENLVVVRLIARRSP